MFPKQVKSLDDKIRAVGGNIFHVAMEHVALSCDLFESQGVTEVNHMEQRCQVMIAVVPSTRYPKEKVDFRWREYLVGSATWQA